MVDGVLAKPVTCSRAVTDPDYNLSTLQIPTTTAIHQSIFRPGCLIRRIELLESLGGAPGAATMTMVSSPTVTTTESSWGFKWDEHCVLDTFFMLKVTMLFRNGITDQVKVTGNFMQRHRV